VWDTKRRATTYKTSGLLIEPEQGTRPKPCTYIIIIIIIVIIIIIFIIEFLTSQLWLGNIHLSWDAELNRIRLGGLICSLKSFLQLNMCQELQIFAAVYMYWGAG